MKAYRDRGIYDLNGVAMYCAYIGIHLDKGKSLVSK